MFNFIHTCITVPIHCLDSHTCFHLTDLLHPLPEISREDCGPSSLGPGVFVLAKDS